MTATLRLAAVLFLAFSAFACGGPDATCTDSSANTSEGVHFDFVDGSSPWWVAFTVSNTDIHVQHVSVRLPSGEWVYLAQTGIRGLVGRYWTHPQGFGMEPVTLRMVGMQGVPGMGEEYMQLEEEIPAVTSGGTYVGRASWEQMRPRN